MTLLYFIGLVTIALALPAFFAVYMANRPEKKA
jgi:hypothetical protein